MSDLPVDIDSTFPDRDAGDALHQQHHDSLHALYNELKGSESAAGLATLQAILDGTYAPLASPALTGTPTAPTAAPGTDTTQVANTAFVKGAVDNATSGVAAHVGGKAGDLLTNLGGVAAGVITTVAGAEYALPFVIPAGRTIASFNLNVNSAGAGGSVVRFGIRADDDGWPGTLLVEAGTVAVSSTGIKTLASAQAPPTGSLIWVVAAVQGGTPGLINGGALLGRSLSIAQPSSWSAATFGCPLQSGVSGALPASGGPRGTWSVTNSPLLAVVLA